MPGPNIYASAGAFRKALEDRLRRIAQVEKVDVNRLRRQVAFDRLLARLFLLDQPRWATGRRANEVVREMLQEANGVSLDDWL